MIRSFLILTILFFSSSVVAQDVDQMIRQVSNSVVTVKALAGGQSRQGSGFFVGKQLLVTNYHLIKGAESAVCYTDDPSKSYKIEGSLNEDEEADLILLKVAALDRPALAIAIDPAVIGQNVIAIGMAMGSRLSAEGSISEFSEADGVSYLSLAAVVAPEYAGGAVMNEKGEVLAVSLGRSSKGKNNHLSVSADFLKELIASKSDTLFTLAELNGEEKKPAPAVAAGNIPRDAQVDVSTIDYKNNILPNEVIIFRGKTGGGEFQGQTDSTGKFSLRLPAGDDYEIFILGFKDSTSYNVLKVPALGEKQFFKKSFKVEVKFQPPHTFVLEDCNFNTGKSTLMPESFSVLDELVKYLNRKDDQRIEIGGHTDNVGQAAANLKLSLDRANVVRDYLIKKGIDASRLVAQGYGSTKPVADNKTADGRATNRRTEVTVLE